jgi:hypothetical protein
LALETWWAGAKVRLSELTASAGLMASLRSPDLSAVRAANDQVSATSFGLSGWLALFPCPDKALGDRLGAVTHEGSMFAGRLKRQLATDGYDLRFIQDLLVTLVRQASEFVVDVAERLEGQ